ncbi:hypothetical protein [Salibacterium aidingense]|uniref:hypothetical protein n=1 Tax=Salibacterium aidingense TaxID=384933 RepID=UPI000400242A|nr:hypothetical protein [Salibacterium aidingense]
MLCFCEKNDRSELRVEADVAVDPVWCNRCSYNLELEDLPLSEALKTELMNWVLRYGEWIDWDHDDRLVPGGLVLETAHNKEGKRLTERVQQELGADFRVVFRSSVFGWLMYRKPVPVEAVYSLYGILPIYPPWLIDV